MQLSLISFQEKSWKMQTIVIHQEGPGRRANPKPHGQAPPLPAVFLGLLARKKNKTITSSEIVILKPAAIVNKSFNNYKIY